MGSLEAEHLLAAAQRGDRAALQALLARHRKTVFRYGLRYCGSTEDTEDAVQETLWAASRAIGGFRRAAAITTWLFTIVRNKCYRVHQHKGPDLADVLPPIPQATRSPEDELAVRQIQELLADALFRLAPLHREVLLLRDVEGLTAPEAAERLSISVQALKSRLFRARGELRAVIQANPVAELASQPS